MSRPAPLVEITPAPPESAPADPAPPREDRCWNLSPAVQERLEAALAEVLGPSLADICRQPLTELRETVRRIVGDFFAVYARRPFGNNKGGMLFNDSLCLYAAVRILDPELIVESGTYQGHSAWLLRQACPRAEIHSFDIHPEQRLHSEPDVTYHAGDWTETALPPLEGRRALAWFDDHINQALRLTQAHERGFRQALFDDNFPVFTLYATGGAPVPTLAMVVDEALSDGAEISWMRHGKTYIYRHDLENVSKARALLHRYIELPDLTAVTRYSPPSGMTYVELVD